MLVSAVLEGPNANVLDFESSAFALLLLFFIMMHKDLGNAFISLPLNP